MQTYGFDCGLDERNEGFSTFPFSFIVATRKVDETNSEEIVLNRNPSCEVRVERKMNVSRESPLVS